MGKLTTIMNEAEFAAASKLPTEARKAAHVADNIITDGIPLTAAGFQDVVTLLKSGMDEYALYRILCNGYLYTAELVPGLGAITREQLLEKLVIIAKSEAHAGLKRKLFYRLKAINLNAAKGYVYEVFFAAEKKAKDVSRDLAIDKQRDIDAILPTGEYCQLKNVTGELKLTESLEAWLKGAKSEVGVENVRIVLPPDVKPSKALEEFLTHEKNNFDLSVVFSITFPP